MKLLQVRELIREPTAKWVLHREKEQERRRRHGPCGQAGKGAGNWNGSGSRTIPSAANGSPQQELLHPPITDRILPFPLVQGPSSPRLLLLLLKGQAGGWIRTPELRSNGSGRSSISWNKTPGRWRHGSRLGTGAAF
jgi:hypothetical protein